MLTLATSYRMLFGHPPHVVGPGKTLLVWGAAGGLGSMAIQLAKVAGARSVGIVSSDDKAEFVRSLGAAGVVNRREFDCWGKPPSTGHPAAYNGWLKEVRRFGKAIWAQLGTNANPDIVFEHCGADTFAVSCYVATPGGMVVFCAATSGYDLTFDARYAWMRQKRLQGSHFANLKQADEANRLVGAGLVSPCLSSSFGWNDLPAAHQMMRDNRHAPGNMAVLVQAHAGDGRG
jgi:crotonyl-CoA carboxylase/reductase